MSTKNVLSMISPMSFERINGIARYAKEHGWNLVIQDRLGHTPLAWNGDGVIATLRSDAAPLRCIRSLIRRGIPVVDLAVSRPDIRVPRVVSDHRRIGRLAAQHFAEHGFRHIAWFSTFWGNVHRLRYRGFTDGWDETPRKWVLSDELPARLQSDWRAFVKWVRQKVEAAEKPLAVLTYDETDAARLLYAAKENAVSVPEEMAILSVGNNPLICENQSVPLSSVDQNLDRGGYEAAKLLDRLMADPAGWERRTDREILVPPAGVVTRRSTDVIAVADPVLRQALEFIGGNLGKPIGSPQVATAVGTRRTDLDRRFRETLSHSVGEEIRRQRLAHVRLLLETTRLPIGDIAGKTGYCTPSHLSNAFRATTGLTPRQWRTNRQRNI